MLYNKPLFLVTYLFLIRNLVFYSIKSNKYNQNFINFLVRQKFIKFLIYIYIIHIFIYVYKNFFLLHLIKA